GVQTCAHPSSPASQVILSFSLFYSCFQSLHTLLLKRQFSPFFFSSRRRHTSSVSAFLLNRSSDLHLLMEAKHWGLRKSRNATSLNSRFKSLDTLKVKIISVTFRRVIRTNHKKASKIWRHENIQLGGCQS